MPGSALYFQFYSNNKTCVNIRVKPLFMKKKSIYHLDKPLVKTVFDQIFEYLHKKYHIRYNTMSHTCDIKPIHSKKWEVVNTASLYIELSQNNIKTSLKNVEMYLKSHLVEKFDPIENYFSHLPDWDGTDYISEYVSYIDFKELDLAIYHFKKWMVRAVKCALIDGYANKQCFVLYQKAQNKGKTTWIRNLCPEELSDYIAEDIGFDKDSRVSLTRNMLVNLDELGLASKSAINNYKSFLSKTQINERLPYDRLYSIIARRASLLASTNDNDFLNDPTGSVRWLCFEIIGEIDFSYKDNVDINMLWAQAYHLAFKDDEFYAEMTPEDIKLNEIRNKKYFNQSSEFELIDKYFTKTNSIEDFKTATDVINLLSFTDGKLNHISAGKALSALGYEKVKHSKLQAYGYLASFKSNQKLQ